MAPAITSEDTVPCSRAACLLARDPSSPCSADLTSLGETAVDMNSSTSTTTQDGKDATADAAIPFHPFARLPSTRSAVLSENLRATDASAKQELHLVDATGQMLPDMINGVGVGASSSLTSLNLSNACRVSLKPVPPRTVSIVIKNNGARGIVSNSVHRPATASGSCNGGSGSCASTNVAAPVGRLPRPHGSYRQFVARPVTSADRTLSTPRMPNCIAARGVSSSGADCVGPVAECDTAGDRVRSCVEQSRVVLSRIESEQAAADVSLPMHAAAQSEAVVTLDAVLSRQRALVSLAGRTLLRLRRLQSREANSSARRQLAGLAATLRRAACQSATLNDLSAAARSDVRTTADLRSMSTHELVGFVRQMQSPDVISALAPLSKSSSVRLSVCPDMADTADRLSSNLRHLESAVDSDATESSSGGETDDEVEPAPAASDEYVVVSDA